MARPFQPSPRRGEGVHTWQSQIWCRLQSKQLCTMQGQRSFVLHESTQEWCSDTFSGTTAKPTTPIHTTSSVPPRSPSWSGPGDPSPSTTVSLQWQTHSNNHFLTWPQRWWTAQLLSHLLQSLLHGEYMEDGMGIRKGLTIKCVDTDACVCRRLYIHVCGCVRVHACVSVCLCLWECDIMSVHVYM